MKIFISYRRDDTRTVVGRIYDRLAPVFGEKNVFRDIDIIPPGTDFRDVLQTSILECDVMLVIIGEKWLTLKDETGKSRIYNPDDFVHIEIARALAVDTFHIKVIPVVVLPAMMPRTKELPLALVELAYQQAWKIGEDPDFHRDMNGLISHLHKIELTFLNEYQSEQNKVKIKPTKPRLFLQIMLVIIVLIVALSGVVAIIYLATDTPATIQVEDQAIVGNEPDTIFPTFTSVPVIATPSPPPVPTLLPTNTIDPIIILAREGVDNNTEWTQYSREFNGITMMLVPAGCFIMGGDEQLEHTVCIPPYWIDRYEITVQQFNAYSRQAINPTGWVDNQPRTDINWFEAVAYCQQRGGRLPSEAEWEYAARGVDGLIFPWGNTFHYEFAHALEYTGAPSPVGSRPGNVSWIGAFDMTGNVWEWTNTQYDNYTYPYQLDGRETFNADETAQHVIRGGSFNESNDGDEHFQRASSGQPVLQIILASMLVVVVSEIFRSQVT